MLINVLDFLGVDGAPDVAAAIATASDGDRIYFPGVRPYDAPAGGWRISKSLELFGDGPGSSGSAIRPSPVATDAVFILDPPINPKAPSQNLELPHVYIHDLRITSSIVGVRTGQQGIRFESAATKKLSELRLERLSISWLGGAGVQLHGFDADGGGVVGVGVFDCEISSCGQQGVSLSAAWAVRFVRAVIRSNQLQGIKIRGQEIACYGCLFEDNCAGGGDAQVSAYDDAATPSAMQICRVDACVFRRSTAGPPFVGLRLRQFEGGVCIGGCSFEQPSGAVGGVGIEFAAQANDKRGAPQLLPNRFKNVATAIAVSQAAPLRAFAMFPQYCDPLATVIQCPSLTNDAPVGVPAANGPSSNKVAGLLVPRYDADPGSNMQLGALAYRSDSDPLAGKRLRVVRADPTTGALYWANITTS